MNAFNFVRPRSVAGSAVPSGAMPVHGRTPANLRRWQAGLARLRAGTDYRPRILFIGDSKTVGAGAGDAPTSGGNVFTNGAEPKSLPAQLVKLLVAAGIPASRQSWFASSGLPTPASKIAYDPRLSIPAPWSGGSITLGGVAWATNTTTAMSFTPEGIVDRVEIFAGAGSSSVSYTVNVDGGATLALIVNQAAPFQIKKDVVTFARGAHTINLARAAGDYINLVGMIAQDSAVPAVDVLNAGAYGTVSDYHASTASLLRATGAIAVVLPDLTVIQLGTNDLRTNVPVDTTLANLATLADKAKAVGADVVLVVPTFGPVNGSDTVERREALRQGIVALGAAKNCVVLDQDTRFGSYASANALGLHRDTVPHETSAGYADEAQALLSVLVA